LRAIARSLSFAWASAFVYMSVIQALIRPGGVLGDDEPEQPERGLAQTLLALEQHAAEQSLRPVIALVGRQLQPPRRLDDILRRAFSRGEVRASGLISS